MLHPLSRRLESLGALTKGDRRAAVDSLGPTLDLLGPPSRGCGLMRPPRVLIRPPAVDLLGPFLSRRLESLGALTKGDRRAAAGQDLQEFNLQTVHTPNPQPYTLNPKPEIRNPKPEILSPETKTRNPKSETRNPNPEPETRNQKASVRQGRAQEENGADLK